MSTIPEIQLRDELATRRVRLDAVQSRGAAFPVEHLIAEVDAALERLDRGTYGRCESCHDAIEADRLVADPLVRFCLDHLSQQERLQLERDMALASDIQRALLPPHDVVFAGWDLHYVYRPASTVSGDYCDVITRPTASPTIVVGDVSGKGVSASILMSNLHALFRSLAASRVPFEETVGRVNHIFCASTLPSSFATLAFARLDASGTVELCNAGHCPPLVIRDGRVDVIAPTGAAVGLFCDAQYKTTVLECHTGDLLVLYTDGVTETFDPSGNEYGPERLADIIASRRHASPRDLTLACLRDVEAFAAGAPQRDDLTLMVIRRTGPAA